MAGFAAGEPTAFCCMSYFQGLRGMQAMMDLAITGALVAEFIPLPLAGAGPALGATQLQRACGVPTMPAVGSTSADTTIADIVPHANPQIRHDLGVTRGSGVMTSAQARRGLVRGRAVALDPGGHKAAFLLSQLWVEDRQAACRVFKVAIGSHSVLACGRGRYGG